MTKTPRNWTYLGAKLIIAGFAVGALAASYTHIVHLFNMLGLTGWQAFTAPAFIDGFAILGLLGRSKSFADETRRTGLRIQVAATSVSFIANVVAGETWGGRIFGAMVVIGYVVAEWYADKLHAAPTKAQAVTATRSQAATKAAATRAINKAEAARKAAEKAERAKLNRLAKRAETAALEASFAAESAPVSPAPTPGYL